MPITRRTARPKLRGLRAPRPTAAEEVAELLRGNIFEGDLPPGTTLPEVAVAEQYKVSRNTVREAFRILTNDRFLEYEAHKGVAVRTLTPADVEDIYKVRKLVELPAIKLLKTGGNLLTALRERVEAAEQLAAEGKWREAGTENLNFHLRLATAHESDRIDGIFETIMTEMRLGFLTLGDPEELHGPYLKRNREIYNLLVADETEQARTSLRLYLDDAEKQVKAALSPHD